MPCEPHKRDGRACGGCDAYDPVVDQVLVVKLGAMGDVLRTTALLPEILAAHERAAVTWIARAESLALLRAAPLVDRAFSAEMAPAILATRRFAAVYALDADEEALALAGAAHATVRRGYRAGDHGRAVGVEPPGDETLFRLGLGDDAKRANRRSYLELLASAAALRWSGRRPELTVREAVADEVRAELSELPRPWIGVNAGGSNRWQHKRWSANNLAGFVARLHDEGMSTVLFGSGDDATANARLAARFGPRVRSFASEGSTDRLFAAIAQLDALVTTDTLAMHAAWSLSRPIVALVGPTSAAELDLAADDIKLTAELECLACYRARCDVVRHCMALLTPDIVFGALRARLARSAAVLAG
ncbi:MAG TPA: glycosyltransferase family 9 protein [Candidatus Elarobacter sp.]